MIKPGALASAWEAQALYDKAERYIQQAQALNKDGWDYALWTSLSLELLARAALSNVHPALLAEQDRDRSAANLISALGFPSFESSSAPKSITVSEVFNRLAALLPNFHKENASFGTQHTGRRNAELHSGEPAFDGLKTATWQPKFYQTCKILLESMGKTLEEFVGADEAKAAEAVMAAAADESAKAVKGDVAAHQKVWESKDTKERKTLTAQALLWARRSAGHRVRCPACKSAALVSGEAVTEPTQKLENDTITERQEYLPTHLECVACGLKVNGLSRLAVVDLADRYVNTKHYDAAEYYATQQDEWYGYEEDNNEPF
jgi:hypothetical protein